MFVIILLTEIEKCPAESVAVPAEVLLTVILAKGTPLLFSLTIRPVTCAKTRTGDKKQMSKTKCFMVRFWFILLVY